MLLSTVNALYLCVMPVQLGWTKKTAQVTERPPVPFLSLSPYLRSPCQCPWPFLRMSFLAPLGQYPRLTMAGFPLPPAWPFPALSECERLREEGASQRNGKVPGNLDCGTCGTRHLGIWGPGWEAESFILEGGSRGYREMGLVKV